MENEDDSGNVDSGSTYPPMVGHSVCIEDSDSVDQSSENIDNKDSESEVVDPEDEKQNDSHIGEQTPGTFQKREFVTKAKYIINQNINTRRRGYLARTSNTIRNIPLPALSWCDHKQLIGLMHCREEVNNVQRDPLIFRKHADLNSRMRAILFDWLIEVCDVYKLRRSTYYLAVDLIERVLTKSDSISKQHLQLLGITCLFISAKVEEIYPPKLVELAYVTDGACTDLDMQQKEIEILKLLDWNMKPLTITEWLSIFMQLETTQRKYIRSSEISRRQELNDDVVYPQFSPYLFMKASFIIDLCSLDDGMLQFSYSVIAASALFYIKTREIVLYVSGYKWEEIRSCVQWMEPFAVVVNDELQTKQLVPPKDYSRNGCGLRIHNPAIVLAEGHTIQTHDINSNLLEKVYKVVKKMRAAFNVLQEGKPTGWTLGTGGYDASLVDKWMEENEAGNRGHSNYPSSTSDHSSDGVSVLANTPTSGNNLNSMISNSPSRSPDGGNIQESEEVVVTDSATNNGDNERATSSKTSTDSDTKQTNVGKKASTSKQSLKSSKKQSKRKTPKTSKKRRSKSVEKNSMIKKYFTTSATTTSTDQERTLSESTSADQKCRKRALSESASTNQKCRERSLSESTKVSQKRTSTASRKIENISTNNDGPSKAKPQKRSYSLDSIKVETKTVGDEATSPKKSEKCASSNDPSSFFLSPREKRQTTKKPCSCGGCGDTIPNKTNNKRPHEDTSSSEKAPAKKVKHQSPKKAR